MCKFEMYVFSYPFVQFKFTIYGHNQASRHTHPHAQCSHASVGLAQARPNYHIICDNIILQNIVGSISPILLQMSWGKIFNIQ